MGFICNLQCDFLVPVLKKTKMSQFSSPSKKTTIAPQKTMKNVLHYLEQQKKSLKKILQKKLKNNREKKDEKCPTLPRTTKKKFEKYLAKKAEKQSRKKI